jgi:hypothetical protein
MAMSNIEADFGALAQLPSMLGDVRAGLDMLKTLASAPAAVAATGSPPASAAIVALNVGLAYLLADLVKGLDDDIEGILEVQRNYRNNEDVIVEYARLGERLLCGASQAQRPQICGPSQNGRAPVTNSARH